MQGLQNLNRKGNLGLRRGDSQRRADGVSDNVGGASYVSHEQCVVDEEISATVMIPPAKQPRAQNCYQFRHLGVLQDLRFGGRNLGMTVGRLPTLPGYSHSRDAERALCHGNLSTHFNLRIV